MSPFPLTVIVPLRRVGCWLLTGALYGVLWQLLPSVADDVAVLSGRTLLGLVPFCRLELVKLRKEPVVVPLTSTCLEAGRDVSTALLDKGSMLVLQKYIVFHEMRLENILYLYMVAGVGFALPIPVVAVGMRPFLERMPCLGLGLPGPVSFHALSDVIIV